MRSRGLREEEREGTQISTSHTISFDKIPEQPTYQRTEEAVRSRRVLHPAMPWHLAVLWVLLLLAILRRPRTLRSSREGETRLRPSRRVRAGAVLSFSDSELTRSRGRTRFARGGCASRHVWIGGWGGAGRADKSSNPFEADRGGVRGRSSGGGGRRRGGWREGIGERSKGPGVVR
jgi:hypothetical protein